MKDDKDHTDNKLVTSIEGDKKAIKSNSVNNENVSEENINTDYENIKIDNKNSKNKIIILILSIIILLIASIIVWLLFFNKNKENIENESELKQEELSESRQIEIINNYGKDIESAIANSNKLSYEELIASVNNDEKVFCSIHEIYTDGKIYLDDCTIDSVKTNVFYGVKQASEDDTDTENEENKDTHTMEVYYNTESSKATTEKPTNMDGYITYKVTDINNKITEPLFNTNYIVYFDDNFNNTYLKNFKTDTDVLPRKDYESIMPISSNEIWRDDYFAIKVDGKWGIYSIAEKKFVVPAIYSSMRNFQRFDSSYGPNSTVNTYNTNNIPVCKDNVCGLVNYINNTVVIPINYNIFEVENYFGARELKSSTIKVYDYSGKEYLTNLNKIYGIIGYEDGKEYAFVVEDNHSKIYSINGTMLYDYGEFLGSDQQDAIGAYFDRITYRKDNGKCVQYHYDFDKKTGTVSDNIKCDY